MKNEYQQTFIKNKQKKGTNSQDAQPPFSSGQCKSPPDHQSQQVFAVWGWNQGLQHSRGAHHHLNEVCNPDPIFNTRRKNFFSLLSYRASRIGMVRELLSLIRLRIFTYLIWIFHPWIYHTQSSLRLSCLSIASLLLSISLSPSPLPPNLSLFLSLALFTILPGDGARALHTANAPHWNYTHNSRLTYSSPV